MRIVALEYHDVVPSGRWDESGFPGGASGSYKLSPELFRAHLDAVAAARPNVINDIRTPAAAGNVPVVWTFDDGGAGYLAHAADHLEYHGWRGHLFVTTGNIGHPAFLTASDLRELQARGHVVGTHSRSHPLRFSHLTVKEQEDEWISSSAALADVLGTPVVVGSVPGGFFNTEVARTAARCGLRFLFTSEPAVRVRLVDDCAVLGRFTLRNGDSAALAAGLVSSSVPRVRQWCWWNAKKLGKAVAGNAYARLRDRLLER